MHDRTSPPEDFVQSVGRALRVLEVVAQGCPLPVKVIARKCELNLSTTYHLVRTLAYEGYLERLSDGTYTSGSEVARRFYDVLSGLGHPPDSKEVLRHLAARTGLSAYLGRLKGDRVVVVDYVEGPGSPYLEHFERGLDVSAHATALGKALLLGLKPRERREVLRDQGLRPFTRNTSTDLGLIEAQLRTLTADSVVVERGEFRDDVSCAARLVPRRAPGETSWALVVSTRGMELPQAARAELCLAACDLAGAAAGA